MLNQGETLKRLLRRVKAADGAITDLREEGADGIVSLLALFVGAGGFVLHGANRTDGPPILAPRQANDLFRQAGNRRGVYASVDWIQVLLHALLARSYLQARLGSVVVGYRRIGQAHQLRVTPELFRLLSERDPELWSPGLVYVLRRSVFEPPAPGGSEFFSPEPVAAEARLLVGAHLKGVVIGEADGALDHVTTYDPEELQAFRSR